MSWCDLLAHLTDYRNPFVTVQLLPKDLDPRDYVYKVHDNAVAFTGDEVEDEFNNTVPQCGDVCFDGGSYPKWAGKFNFKFRPPKLTSCKLLSTEIAKMNVDNIPKYLVIMIREGKFGKERNYKTFRFLTAYDSRCV
jgi:hypothetical protein